MSFPKLKRIPQMRHFKSKPLFIHIGQLRTHSHLQRRPGRIYNPLLLQLVAYLLGSQDE